MASLVKELLKILLKFIQVLLFSQLLKLLVNKMLAIACQPQYVILGFQEDGFGKREIRVGGSIH